MRHTVVFSLRAGRHLDDLYRVISEKSGPARADKFVSSIVDYCLAFDMFPERGARRDDLWPGMRVVGFKRVASIAFRVKGDRVIIQGIYYGGQDFESDLKVDKP